MINKLSQNGLEMIKQFEGLSLNAYKCLSGILTIGYGHTNGVRVGQVITEEKAEELLKEDIVKFERYVNEFMNGYNYEWNQNQFDALVSFCFNLGYRLKQLTDNGNRSNSEISIYMLLYYNANGKKVSGLVKRRQIEHDLFCKNMEVETCVDAYTPDIAIEENISKKQCAKNFESGFQNGKKLIVRSATSMRIGYTINHKTLKVLAKNDKVTYYGYYTIVDGFKWYYVKSNDGKLGFIQANSVYE